MGASASSDCAIHALSFESCCRWHSRAVVADGLELAARRCPAAVAAAAAAAVGLAAAAAVVAVVVDAAVALSSVVAPRVA